MLPDQELAEHPPPSYSASNIGAEVLEEGNPSEVIDPVPINKMMDEVKRLEREKRLEEAREKAEKERKEEARRKAEETKRNEEQKKQKRSLSQQKKEEEENERESGEKASQTYQTVSLEATAYTNGVESTGKKPEDPTYGITASGRPTQAGLTVACAPSIELGTWVHIEGIGNRRCDDRGSKITEGHIDIYMKHLSKAQEFGRKKVEVTILGEEG